MDYRGIEYTVRARPGHNKWVWTIFPKGTPAVACEFFGTRDEAIAAACKTIDRRWRLMGLPKEQAKIQIETVPSGLAVEKASGSNKILGGPPPVIKSELVERVAAQNPHLYARDLEQVVNAILGEIVTALSRGDRVEIRGFGVFSIRNRRARTGRNPRSGAIVVIDQKSIPFFKSGKEMRQRLNRSKT